MGGWVGGWVGGWARTRRTYHSAARAERVSHILTVNLDAGDAVVLFWWVGGWVGGLVNRLVDR